MSEPLTIEVFERKMADHEEMERRTLDEKLSSVAGRKVLAFFVSTAIVCMAMIGSLIFYIWQKQDGMLMEVRSATVLNAQTIAKLQSTSEVLSQIVARQERRMDRLEDRPVQRQGNGG